MSVAISWFRLLMTSLLPDVTTSSETEEDPESENSEPHVESGAMAAVFMVVAAAAALFCKWPPLPLRMEGDGDLSSLGNDTTVIVFVLRVMQFHSFLKM